MPLHLLRQAKLLTRLVLVWFVLSLGVAVASPLVKPGSVQLVCSGTSVKLVNTDGDEASAHTLDCPLCGSAALALPVVPLGFVFDSPLSQALARDVSAHLAVLTAAPLSARAPPVL
jgi:hypothetical protein